MNHWTALIAPPSPPAWRGACRVFRLLDGPQGCPATPERKPRKMHAWRPWTPLSDKTNLRIAMRKAPACWALLRAA